MTFWQLDFFCLFLGFLRKNCNGYKNFWTLKVLWNWYSGNVVPGWTELMLSIYFLGAIQLISIGFIGEYISSKIIPTPKKSPDPKNFAQKVVENSKQPGVSFVAFFKRKLIRNFC